jgi:hypothetical protein
MGKGMAAAAATAASKRSTVQKFQALLEEELEKGLFDDALESVKTALNATRTVRVRTEAGIGYQQVPDFAVQLAAGVTVLQYALGKPVNRTEMVVKGDSEATAGQRAARAAETLLEDPETLMGVLDDWRAAAQQVAGRKIRAQPLDLPAVDGA